MIKILTPAEVEIASMPAALEEVARINISLTRGKRWFVVEPGLAPTITRLLSASGWDSKTAPNPDGRWIIVDVSERRS